MIYAMRVSYDCGETYQIEKKSENLWELRAIGVELDERMLRWVIVDDEGRHVDCCKIHKEIAVALAKVSN